MTIKLEEIIAQLPEERKQKIQARVQELIADETLYLLRSPQNAQRLYKALDDLKQGKYQEHDLIENE